MSDLCNHAEGICAVWPSLMKPRKKDPEPVYEYRVTVIEPGLVDNERAQYGRSVESKFMAGVQLEVTPRRLLPRIERREVGDWEPLP